VFFLVDSVRYVLVKKVVQIGPIVPVPIHLHEKSDFEVLELYLMVILHEPLSTCLNVRWSSLLLYVLKYHLRFRCNPQIHLDDVVSDFDIRMSSNFPGLHIT
jgi:hypothetical protein